MSRQDAYRKTGCSWLSIVLLLLATENASSEVYRWVDTEGKVFYSDKKPKTAAQDITAEVNKQNIDESIAEQRKLQSIFRPENDADRDYHRKQQSAAQLTAEATGNCRRSRELLGVLNGRVQLLDGQGKEIKFTESDRQRQVSEIQAYLKENCNP